MREKQGFSLVEFVIVLGIMTVMFGFMSLGLWYVFAEDAESAAQSINSGLTYLKSENTAKSAPSYMHIYQDGGTYYLVQSEKKAYDASEEGKDIGDDDMTITVDTPDGSSVALDDNTVISFGVSKKDGAITTWAKAKDGTDIKTDIKTGLTKVNCVLSNDRYSVKVVQATGKHFVKSE